jgi:hypothetical protein
MESGAGVAAQKLAGLDLELVVTAFAQHILVFDRAAVSASIADGEEAWEDRIVRTRTGGEVGPYVIEAKRTDAWDEIVELLLFIETECADFFHRLMSGCRNLSNSGYEIDGLDDLLARGEQEMFDVAIDRERRRERQGYVSPGQARAFLQSARRVQLAGDAPPSSSPIAAAYFRGIHSDPQTDSVGTPASMLLPQVAPVTDETATAVAAVMDLLVEGGVVQPAPRALIAGSQEQVQTLGLLHAHLQMARDAGGEVYTSRASEFAFLANAILAGCSIQARSFTEQEASDAAAAVCNLGLENWPAAWRSGTVLPDDFLLDHDLIQVFEVGWTILHDEVSMYAAAHLIDVLIDFQCGDIEVQRDLDELRLQLTNYSRAGTPWRARGAMDALMLLDMSAWAALVGLIAECPVMHAAMNAGQGSHARSVSASAFEFIAENRHIAAVRTFMQGLPETLRA